MKNKLYILLFTVLMCFATSCNDFLDEAPDNRTEIDTQEKVRQLLVSAYPLTSFYSMTEMASDNTDESRLGAWEYEVDQREMYEWRDVSSIDTDSPHQLWEDCYKAIATANIALEAIEKMGSLEVLDPQKGEALMCRAYAHFVLVNVFSQHFSSTSNSDLGIPYVTKPETTVEPVYNRETVAVTYEKIDKDIEVALKLIDNKSYKIEKYHFNKKAAYAFAARFNLYYCKYDKVKKYSEVVLGADASLALRDWEAAGKFSVNGNLQPDLFINNTNPATLMLISTISSWAVWHGPYSVGRKYSHNEYVYNTETIGTMTPWGDMTQILHYKVFSNPNVNKVIMRKIGYYFKYSDPIAGIGQSYLMQPTFTTDETLLCRAEAHIMEKNYTEALADMNAFMTAFTSSGAVTADEVNTFFSELEYYKADKPTLKKKLNPTFTIAEGEQENFTHCLLHLRRMLTLHEGLRWFDIKRYGIEIHRRQLGGGVRVTDTLVKGDPRRAMQLPTDVIDAGLPANPR